MKMFKSFKILFLLFRITFSISAFTFGGGYIAIPMMRKSFVEKLELLSEKELMDMSAIAQSTPGAIAVNIAVLVGYRIAGIKGAVISCIGTVLPPLVIISLLSVFYQAFRDNSIVSAILKGMEAGVAAIIVDLLIDMSRVILKENNALMTFLPIAVFVVSFIFNINVLLLILLSAILCLIQTYLTKRKRSGFR